MLRLKRLGSYDRSEAESRLPEIAFCGIFQGGKSLILNAALGAPIVPVGIAGLRTTPCLVRCKYGEFARALVHEANGVSVPYNLANLASRFYRKDEDGVAPSCVDIACCHPLLQKITLVDTPGVDHSTADDELAIKAAKKADALVLVVQQALPLASRSFVRLLEVFNEKTWGLVLNCGRAGDHLSFADSAAAIMVEGECLRQLASVGLRPPSFSMRLSGETLPHYLHVHARPHRPSNWESDYQAFVASDEDSVRSLRHNLIELGYIWLRFRFELAEQKFLADLKEQEWEKPKIRLDQRSKTFRSTVGYAGSRYSVAGTVNYEETHGWERIALQEFRCRESWVSDYFQSITPWKQKSQV